MLSTLLLWPKSWSPYVSHSRQLHNPILCGILNIDLKAAEGVNNIAQVLYHPRESMQPPPAQEKDKALQLCFFSVATHLILADVLSIGLIFPHFQCPSIACPRSARSSTKPIGVVPISIVYDLKETTKDRPMWDPAATDMVLVSSIAILLISKYLSIMFGRYVEMHHHSNSLSMWFHFVLHVEGEQG